MPPERTSLSAAAISSGEGLVGLGRSWKPVEALAVLEGVDMVLTICWEGRLMMLVVVKSKEGEEGKRETMMETTIKDQRRQDITDLTTDVEKKRGSVAEFTLLPAKELTFSPQQTHITQQPKSPKGTRVKQSSRSRHTQLVLSRT